VERDVPALGPLLPGLLLQAAFRFERIRFEAVDSKQIQQIAMGVGAFGALVVAWGSGLMVWAQRSYQGPSESHHRKEKVAHLLGALLISAGFGGLLAATMVH
jgi:hypothetical protein